MAQKGRIDAYLDCNSPYSFYAFTWLKRNKKILGKHGVAVDFHPIFLGGINVGSGNKPPWTLPAKASYAKFDGPRAQRYFGTMEMKPPAFFPIMSLLPMRCMLYIKDVFDSERYEAQFGELWNCYWGEHMDLSKPDTMITCLRRNFNEQEARQIIEAATSQKYKEMLTDQTAALVSKGAFGAPWYVVKNVAGKEEPFFGSDRFHYMLQFLGLPFSDIKIQPATESKL